MVSTTAPRSVTLEHFSTDAQRVAQLARFVADQITALDCANDLLNSDAKALFGADADKLIQNRFALRQMTRWALSLTYADLDEPWQPPEVDF